MTSPPPRGIPRAMAKKPTQSETEQARLARRAEALRANLQKRKAQVRARKSGASAEGETPGESSKFSGSEPESGE